MTAYTWGPSNLREAHALRALQETLCVQQTWAEWPRSPCSQGPPSTHICACLPQVPPSDNQAKGRKGFVLGKTTPTDAICVRTSRSAAAQVLRSSACSGPFHGLE